MKRKEYKRPLDAIREKFRATIEAAASKYNELVNSSHIIMPAVYNAERTKSKNATEVFSIDDKHRFREIKREVRRAEAFLREAGSDDYTMYDKRYEAAKSADHRFGGEFSEQFGVSYYAPLVDPDFARTAFDIYHRVESNVIRQSYESETLINAIYDMVVEEGGEGENYIEQKKLELINFLQEKYLETTTKASLELLHQDSEYGVLEKSKSAKDFYLGLAEKYNNKGRYF